MTKITQTPKIVLMHGITALIIFLTSIFTSGSIDIAIHDTYLVMGKAQLIIAIALLFVLFTIVTLGVEKMLRPLSSVLNWLHFGLTTTCLIIIGIIGNKLMTQSTTFKDYSVLDEVEEYESMMSINEWLTILVVTLILSQILFLVNIIRAFIVKRKSL